MRNLVIVISLGLFLSTSAIGQTEELKIFVSEYYAGKTVTYQASSAATQTALNGGKCYSILVNGAMSGYACEKVVSIKGEEFDEYFTTVGVLFGNDKVIKSVQMIKYAEHQREEAKNANWARQFIGKSNGMGMIFKKDIKNISRATITCKEVTKAIKDISKVVYTL